MQALTFPVGSVYLILSNGLNGEEALRIQANSVEEFENARVVSTQPNPNDLGQLFMIQKTGLEDDSYEIVNCISGNVFDEEGGEIRVRKGKQVADQLFKLENVSNDLFWIKCEEEGEKAVSLEGILRYKTFDPNDPSQIFRIVNVDNTDALADTSILINNNSGKSLDVPNSSFEHDTRAIQFELNKRFNQRWRFINQGSGVMIQSLLNDLVLDIAGESKEGGSPVILWEKTGGNNQLWTPIEAGNQIWKFMSVHAPGMFLCIQHQSIDNYGKLEIYDEENPSMYWRIDGRTPE